MGIVLEIAAEIRNEALTVKIGKRSAWTGPENADVAGNIGVGANRVDDDGFDNVFAGVTVDVEGEFVIGPAPLTQINCMAGGDVKDLEIFARRFAIRFGSLRDFRYLVSNVARLENGVYLNCGSAVVLPEVFLKAVALARNQGVSFSGLTTVNLDFMRMYRPLTNVVARPTVSSGKGYSLVGHHEIMIPLLAAALIDHDRQHSS